MIRYPFRITLQVFISSLFFCGTMVGSSFLWAKVLPVTEYDKSPHEVFSTNKLEASSGWLDPSFQSHSEDFHPQFSYVNSKGDRVFMDISALSDWEITLALNEKATALGKQLFDCARISHLSVRQIYLDPSRCSSFKPSLSLFREQVLTHMVSGTSGLLKFSSVIQCQKSPGDHFSPVCHPEAFLWIDQLFSPLDSTYHPDYDQFNKFSKDSWGRPFYPYQAELIEYLHWPRFHPLFVQALLEIVAQGYLLPFGTYDCKGGSCLANLLITLGTHWPHKMAFATRQGEYRILGRTVYEQDLQRLNRADEWAKLSLNEGQLPRFDQDFDGLEMTQLNRAALASLRLLYMTGALGETDFSSWGLWPEQSFDLINTLSMTSMFVNFQIIKSQIPYALLFWMSLSIERKIAKGYIGVRTRDPDLLMRLAEIGAWRRLWEDDVQEEKPSERNQWEELYDY